MAPTRLSQRWYRRFYAGLFLATLILVALYVSRQLGLNWLPPSVSFNLAATILAGIVMLASGVLFFINQRFSSSLPGLIVYGLFLLTVAYILWQSGGVWSIFTPVWSLTLFIAPLFGAFGWLPALILTASYVAGIYLSSDFTSLSITAIGLNSLLPLGLGSILWSQLGNSDEPTDKNVTNLANRLSEVATKSEIVINAIGDGVIAVDGVGIIQLINPAAQEMLGWGKQDALALNYKSILQLTDENNKDLAPAQDPLQVVLNTNQQARGNRIMAVTKSSKKLSLSIVVSPIGAPGSGAIAVFRDITKERAEEREQAEFISTASHEMRTPVASIEGYLGLALNANTATVDVRAADFINKAHEAAQHLGRLFQDLLDVSKSEDGRMTNTPKVVDIVPFTQTIVEGLRQKATDKGLTLSFAPQDSTAQRKIMPVYYTNVDNDHLREVLDNLIENAIKYTKTGGIQVDVSGSDDNVVVSVKDSGLGIPTEDLTHLFQKFYRVNNVDRQEIGGTGLGLYLSRRLVEAMQGRLWVESVFEQGSTFFIELPRVSGQQVDQLRASEAQQAAQMVATTVTEPAPVLATLTTPPAPAVGSPVTPSAQPTPAVAPTPVPAPPAAPATTVPRGESLTREQIAERARQLELLVQQQRASEQQRQ